MTTQKQSKPSSACIAVYIFTLAMLSTTPTATAQTKTKKWLSTIGNIVNAASSISRGQSVSGNNGNYLSSPAAGNNLVQLFNYSGEQRKGQRDANGRIIKNEITAPIAYGKAHYVFYEDDYCMAYSITTCVGCYGKGRCYVCNGLGRVYNTLCGCCGGTGRCKNCQGAGYKMTTKLWAPGEAGDYLAAKRQMNQSSSSSTTSSSKTTVCSKCGGKGYTPTAYTYAAGSSLAPYHNSAGTSCAICNLKTDHYHYRCLECKSH